MLHLTTFTRDGTEVKPNEEHTNTCCVYAYSTVSYTVTILPSFIKHLLYTVQYLKLVPRTLQYTTEQSVKYSPAGRRGAHSTWNSRDYRGHRLTCTFTSSILDTCLFLTIQFISLQFSSLYTRSVSKAHFNDT